MEAKKILLAAISKIETVCVVKRNVRGVNPRSQLKEVCTLPITQLALIPEPH